MNTQNTQAIAAIAQGMRSSVSRRRLLQAAGIGSAAMVATACGTGSSDSTEASAAEDMSDSEMVVNWSNWPLYLDEDEDTGGNPSLEEFQSSTGIDVTYTPDINDNNEFYAKVRTQLEQGQDIGRDMVVLTDWMAALWIQSGYAQKLDKAIIPNAVNLIPRLAEVQFDTDRSYSLPWQSGFAGLGFNIPALKEATGQTYMSSLDQLFDPALKGRITVLSEMRDTMGCILGSLGYDATDFTDAEFEEAIAELTKHVDSGQIRQVTGNDYIAAMDSGDVIAVIGWSGDVIALGEDFGFSLPESGGMLWTDNMLIPSLAQHKKNAEQVMNYYYDPEVAAQVAAWVNYLCPVEGAQAAMEKLDPELATSEWIFPSASVLDSANVFMELTPEQNEAYERLFQKATGN
ncbi:MAG: spermidine/putrescine ABC transporter substrate-binding protein [Candidatus Nanopelagicales bacterium]|nr:spermidine/putrescine ABC transporter substrate-binding protein [Candidatus Nanopelagicales bacterium]